MLNHMPPLAPGQPEVVFSKSTGHRRSMEKKYVSKLTTVRNMRGHEEEFDLDVQGFKLVKLDPIPENVYSLDREKFAEVYYPEVKEYLKKL